MELWQRKRVHARFLSWETSGHLTMTLRLGTAVLRTRMTGGVGGGGSIPPPTRFALVLFHCSIHGRCSPPTLYRADFFPSSVIGNDHE